MSRSSGVPDPASGEHVCAVIVVAPGETFDVPRDDRASERRRAHAAEAARAARAGRRAAAEPERQGTQARAAPAVLLTRRGRRVAPPGRDRRRAGRASGPGHQRPVRWSRARSSPSGLPERSGAATMCSSSTSDDEGATMMDRDKLFIGGEWVEPSSTATIEVISPHTEEVDRDAFPKRRTSRRRPRRRRGARGVRRRPVAAHDRRRARRRDGEASRSASRSARRRLADARSPRRWARRSRSRIMGQVIASTMVLDYFTQPGARVPVRGGPRTACSARRWCGASRSASRRASCRGTCRCSSPC